MQAYEELKTKRAKSNQSAPQEAVDTPKPIQARRRRNWLPPHASHQGGVLAM